MEESNSKGVQDFGNAPNMNPIFGEPIPTMATNEQVNTEYDFGANIRRALSAHSVFMTNTVFPDIPRTRLCANEHILLTQLIRSMTDEIEGHLNKIEEDPTKCNADNFAALAIACKQMQFMIRSTLVDVDTPQAKELAEMIRLYNQKKKYYV